MNVAGLILNMLGVVGLAIFGIPQPDHTQGFSLGIEPATVLADGRSVQSMIDARERRRRLYRLVGYLSLAVIFLGFLFQLIGALTE